jgi:hypothetical protein
MNKLKTGVLSAAHAERAGKPSKKGRPTATAPARKKARRFTVRRGGKPSAAKELPSGAECS